MRQQISFVITVEFICNHEGDEQITAKENDVPNPFLGIPSDVSLITALQFLLPCHGMRKSIYGEVGPLSWKSGEKRSHVHPNDAEYPNPFPALSGEIRIFTQLIRPCCSLMYGVVSRGYIHIA